MQRPILVGGLALSLGLWGLDSVGHILNHVSTVGLMAVAGAGWYWYQRTQCSAAPSASRSAINLAAIDQLLADTESLTHLILQSSGQETSDLTADRVSRVKSQMDWIRASLTDRNLQVVLLGGAGVGKSTLLSVLHADTAITVDPWHLTLQEAPSLFQQAISDDLTSIAVADLVLYLIAGDLTEPDYQVLQTLQARQQPFMVVFNKQDQYLPADRDALLQQIQHRLQPLTESENLVAIAAHPNQIRVRCHDQAGEVQEWLETPPPDVSALTQQLHTHIIQDGEQLRWATAFRQAEQIKQDAKGYLNQLRCDRAQPIVEQYQWIAAGATFVNPLPALDLLATTAVNTQMILELGEVYQQKLSLDHAQTIAGELSQLLVKLGIAELASQAIASTLKSNFITYVVGGTLQGICTAYLTRLVGLSLIEYFQSQDVSSFTDGFSIKTLQDRLQAIFQVQQKALNLPEFVYQGLRRLRPECELTAENP